MSTFIPGTNNPYEFQSNMISGIGAYDDPLSIYLKSHKTFSSNLITSRPDISGIIENIDIINAGLDNSTSTEQIKLFKQLITEDMIIPNNISGLSIDLKFSQFNIETEENIYKNL